MFSLKEFLQKDPIKKGLWPKAISLTPPPTQPSRGLMTLALWFGKNLPFQQNTGPPIEIPLHNGQYNKHTVFKAWATPNHTPSHPYIPPHLLVHMRLPLLATHERDPKGFQSVLNYSSCGGGGACGLYSDLFPAGATVS